MDGRRGVGDQLWKTVDVTALLRPSMAHDSELIRNERQTHRKTNSFAARPLRASAEAASDPGEYTSHPRERTRAAQVARVPAHSGF